MGLISQWNKNLEQLAVDHLCPPFHHLPIELPLSDDTPAYLAYGVALSPNQKHLFHSHSFQRRRSAYGS